MRPTRTLIPRASAFLLVLAPCLLIASASWLANDLLVWELVALMSPLCLLAIWCALGRTNVWLRFAIVALLLLCLAGASSYQPVMPSHIDSVRLLIALFGAVALPLCLLRVVGVSIQLTYLPAPASIATDHPISGSGSHRYTLGSLFQIVTLGALLMAADRLFEFSQLLDAYEIVAGAAMALVAAITAWLCLGTRWLWLRLGAWLTIPAVLYLPLDGYWHFILLIWLGLSAVLAIELLCFRRLGYRMVWGNAPLAGVVDDPLPWPVLLRAAAAVSLIAVYLWVVGKCVAWSQAWTRPWDIDGMATFSAYLTAAFQAPIYLLAIWSALANCNLSIRLLSTAAACYAGTLYLAWAHPYGSLHVEPQSVVQQWLAVALPLWAMRPFGLTIGHPGTPATISAETERPSVFWSSVVPLIGLAAILAGLNLIWPIFAEILVYASLRSSLLSVCVIAALCIACLGSGRWWLRVGVWMVAGGLFISLASEYTIRNAAWVASCSITVGGVLLAFRLRGFRLLRPTRPWLRRQMNPSTTPPATDVTSAAVVGQPCLMK